MVTRFHRLLVVSALLLAGAAHAQSNYPIRGYSLVWDINTKQGAVRINADNDRQPEEVIAVQSMAELNSWGQFLKEHDVNVRVTGSQRALVATRKR